MRISDWSSDVCSSDLAVRGLGQAVADAGHRAEQVGARAQVCDLAQELQRVRLGLDRVGFRVVHPAHHLDRLGLDLETLALRSEEHTSELQSLMRISYAVICLKKKNSEKNNRHR